MNDLYLYIIIGILGFLIIAALIAFRFNYVKQMKVSVLMDNESDTFNKNGLVRYIDRHQKELTKPSLVVVSLPKLAYLYTSYERKHTLMVNIADQFLKGLKKEETVARVEFNKFIVVFNDRSVDEIKAWTKEVDKRLDSIYFENYGTYNFSELFGIHEHPDITSGYAVVEETIGILLYSTARETNIYYFNNDVKASIDKLREINKLKDIALENGEFVPYIQPKVSLETGKVVGGEILVRWLDSSGTVKYYPNDFIPTFEQNGFIKKIDAEMFKQAAKLSNTMVSRGFHDIVISVNASKLNFDSPKFVENLLSVSNSVGANTRNLEIEITESAADITSQHVSNIVMQLKQNGFRLAMDDFGKEYSSLGLLTSSPFDVIKMDAIFFKNNLTLDKDKELAKDVLKMLSKLGVEIVCEGVENQSTIDVIATITHDVVIQGYVFSKPIPLAEFEAFAKNVFELNLPQVQEDTSSAIHTVTTSSDNTSTATTVNITSNNNREYDELRREIDRMRRDIEERDRLDRERKYQDEIDRLRREINNQNQQMPQQPQQQYQGYPYPPYGVPYPYPGYGMPYPYPQQQVQQIDVDALIKEISDKNKQHIDDAMRRQGEEINKRFEDERKEREELERMLHDIVNNQQQEEPTPEEDIVQEKANQNLDLNVLTLSETETKGLADDVEDDDDEDLDIPELTVEQVEAIIRNYQQKYPNDWNVKAKEELSDSGYAAVIGSLKYYQSNPANKVTFVDKVKKLNPDLAHIYNMVKNEFMKYDVSNRLTNKYDVIYKGNKVIAKISFSSVKVKVYIAADPKDERYAKFPHKDLSAKKAHANTPYYTLIQSQLSMKRLQRINGNLMKEMNIGLKSNYKPIDYATKYKFFKHDQKK